MLHVSISNSRTSQESFNVTSEIRELDTYLFVCMRLGGEFAKMLYRTKNCSTNIYDTDNDGNGDTVNMKGTESCAARKSRQNNNGNSNSRINFTIVVIRIEVGDSLLRGFFLPLKKEISV